LADFIPQFISKRPDQLGPFQGALKLIAHFNFQRASGVSRPKLFPSRGQKTREPIVSAQIGIPDTFTAALSATLNFHQIASTVNSFFDRMNLRSVERQKTITRRQRRKSFFKFFRPSFHRPRPAPANPAKTQ
jgi:hypothetical protein